MSTVTKLPHAASSWMWSEKLLCKNVFFSFFLGSVLGCEKLKKASAHRCHVVYIDVIFPFFSLSPPITVTSEKKAMMKRKKSKRGRELGIPLLSAGNFLFSLLISSFNLGEVKKEARIKNSVPSFFILDAFKVQSFQDKFAYFSDLHCF